jgi:hypothetical protein
MRSHSVAQIYFANDLEWYESTLRCLMTITVPSDRARKNKPPSEAERSLVAPGGRMSNQFAEHLKYLDACFE